MTDPTGSPALPAPPSSGPVDTPPPGFSRYDRAATGAHPITGAYTPRPETTAQPYAYDAPIPVGIDPHAKTNTMAITALILGTSGFLLIPACIGIGLGFGALGTIGRTGQPGKGLAIAGITLSGIWLALWLALFIFAG